MKKVLSALVFLVTIAAIPATAQNLDDVLKEHFDAIGQKQLKKIETLTATGKLNQGGLEIPFVQISARPNNIRIEGTFQGLTFIQTYNGTEGWMLNPFTGATEAQPMTADELKGLKIQADMDGMLWDWKDKGYKVELDTTVDVEGTMCYKIDVTTAEGDVYSSYIDTESYLMIKTHTKTTINGVEVESDTFYSNYKDVNGIILPGTIENRYNGNPGEVIIIDKYEIDIQYEQSKFEKPVATK